MSITPNLFQLIKASPAVTAIIGNPPRLYEHGDAPQDVVAPYVTQIAATVTPLNDLSNPPRADACRVQISCWSNNTGTGPASVKVLAEALRDAVEPVHDILAIRDMGKDAETGRYRIDLDAWVYNHR